MWQRLFGATASVVGIALIPVALTAQPSGKARSKTELIVLHATGGPACKDGKVVFTPAGTIESTKSELAAKGLSIHYIVGKKGEVDAALPDNLVALHAGSRVNPVSVGIEMINKGDG